MEKKTILLIILWVLSLSSTLYFGTRLNGDLSNVCIFADKIDNLQEQIKSCYDFDGFPYVCKNLRGEITYVYCDSPNIKRE